MLRETAVSAGLLALVLSATVSADAVARDDYFPDCYEQLDEGEEAARDVGDVVTENGGDVAAASRALTPIRESLNGAQDCYLKGFLDTKTRYLAGKMKRIEARRRVMEIKRNANDVNDIVDKAFGGALNAVAAAEQTQKGGSGGGGFSFGDVLSIAGTAASVAQSTGVLGGGASGFSSGLVSSSDPVTNARLQVAQRAQAAGGWGNLYTANDPAGQFSAADVADIRAADAALAAGDAELAAQIVRQNQARNAGTFDRVAHQQAISDAYYSGDQQAYYAAAQDAYRDAMASSGQQTLTGISHIDRANAQAAATTSGGVKAQEAMAILNATNNGRPYLPTTTSGASGASGVADVAGMFTGGSSAAGSAGSPSPLAQVSPEQLRQSLKADGEWADIELALAPTMIRNEQLLKVIEEEFWK